MLKNAMKQWAEEAVNGERLVCEKEKWACMRFLRDLEREGTKEFPFIFDEDKAMRFLEWMSLFKHTKGKLAGKNIDPAPIQIFNWSNIYGWIHIETGLRRFRKFYYQVARKNAKSQDVSCCLSYEISAFGESSSEAYIGATKRDQANIVFKEIKAQLQGSEVRNKFKITRSLIEHERSNSYIMALSRDSGKTADGFNPQVGAMDEYHAHPTDEILEVIQSGQGARSQPLIVIITTAGFNLNSPCYATEYEYVSKLLDPNSPVENDTYYAMVCELDKGDDIKDERNWIKANPILASYDEGIKFLRDRLKEAIDKPDTMTKFLTKNMNIWVNAPENKYMDMEKWKLCEVPDDELEGKPCFVGVDLSKRLDLTAVTSIFVLGEGKYAVRSKGFMPEEMLQQRMNTDRVNYSLWVDEGWITTTPGEVIDYDFVIDYIESLRSKYSIQEVCYDPYNATQWAQSMENLGYLMIEVRQGVLTLNEPTKHFRECVYEQKIHHDGNKALTWCLGNAVTKADAQDNIMLDKKKSTDRIDMAAAGIFAFTRAMYSDNIGYDLNEEISKGAFSF